MPLYNTLATVRIPQTFGAGFLWTLTDDFTQLREDGMAAVSFVADGPQGEINAHRSYIDILGTLASALYLATNDNTAKKNSAEAYPFVYLNTPAKPYMLRVHFAHPEFENFLFIDWDFPVTSVSMDATGRRITVNIDSTHRAVTASAAVMALSRTATGAVAPSYSGMAGIGTGNDPWTVAISLHPVPAETTFQIWGEIENDAGTLSVLVAGTGSQTYNIAFECRYDSRLAPSQRVTIGTREYIIQTIEVLERFRTMRLSLVDE